MNKLIGVLAGLGLVLALAVGVQAGFDIRQNADGTADWVDGGKDRTFPIGGEHITLYLPDVSTQATVFAPALYDGAIRKIWAVMHGETTLANATLRVYRQTSANATLGAEAYTQITPNAVLTLPYNNSSSSGAGQITSVEPGDTVSATVDFVEISANDVIAVNTDGGSTGTIAATIIIEIEPR